MKRSGTAYLKALAATAMLVAVEVVLSRFCSINTMGWKIGFSFVPVALCAATFGPFWAAACYALADLIGALLFPIGPYFPGFTVVAGIMGAVYGLFVYNKEKPRFFVDILLPTLINCLVLGLALNTVWVSILYSSKNYWGWFVYRLPEYAVLIPLNLIFLPIISRLSAVLRKTALLR